MIVHCSDYLYSLLKEMTDFVSELLHVVFGWSSADDQGLLPPLFTSDLMALAGGRDKVNIGINQAFIFNSTHYQRVNFIKIVIFCYKN